MRDDGICRVRMTDAEIEMIMDLRDTLKVDQKQLQMALDDGEYFHRVPQKLLFFRWHSKELNRNHINLDYPILIGKEFARVHQYEDEIAVYPTSKYELLWQIVSMAKTRGDVYMTPSQCSLFTEIKEIS